MSWLANNWQILAPWVLCAVLYIITFKPAWRLLRRLVVMSAVSEQGLKSWHFWGDFVLYRLVLLAPYVPFWVFRAHVPIVLNRMVFYWVLLMTFFGVLRFAGKDRVISALWWIYGWVYDGLLNFYPYQNLIKIVADRLKLEDGMNVLEVGCGTGNVMMEARKRARVSVVGVDNSSSMLRQARRKLRRAIKAGEAELHKQDALEFLKGLPDASFDRISLVNFLYATPDRQEVWAECMRIRRPGGLIVASTSVKSGSRSIIQENFANSSVFQVLYQIITLRLVFVMVIDFMISGLAEAGAFEFPEQEVLITEVDAAGGVVEHIERCYGGAEHGVNIVFNVTG
jgi:ubiquinone/menaquinone biosynthesis C-methylase UbiE